jgi:hypothetical protein
MGFVANTKAYLHRHLRVWDDNIKTDYKKHGVTV